MDLPSFRPLSVLGRAWRIPVLLLVLIGALLLFERQRQARRAPLTYRIGTVDPRFGLSPAEFAADVERAASLWRRAAGREVFRQDPRGAVEVNLVYDERQEAADRLKALSLRIENTQGSYEELRRRFEALKREADQEGAGLARDFEAFNTRVEAFRKEVEGARSGLDEATARRFRAEQERLTAEKAELERRQEALKPSLEMLRSLALVINEIAVNHNLDVVGYQDVGRRLGSEFSEGEYERKGSRRRITIYHFPSRDGLVRVLAHEVGHALGLGHLEAPGAVMHRLMRSENPELTAEDVAALKARRAMAE